MSRLIGETLHDHGSDPGGFRRDRRTRRAQSERTISLFPRLGDEQIG
jgi:hypothetical protein